MRERDSGRWGSNPRPSAWEADALPTELRPRGPHRSRSRRIDHLSRMAPLRSDDRQSEQRPILTTRRIARTRCHEPRPRSERATPPASPHRRSIASPDVLRIGHPSIAGVRPGLTYNTVREPVRRLKRNCRWGEGMRLRPDQVSGTLHVSVRRIDGRSPVSPVSPVFPLPGRYVAILTWEQWRSQCPDQKCSSETSGGSSASCRVLLATAVPRRRARRPAWRRGPRRGVRT